jgi:hypothetical protein
MRKTTILLAIAAMALLGAAAPASAQAVCYEFTGFCDVMQLDRQGNGLHGLWWACPPRPGSVYNLSVSGSITRLVPGGASFHVGLNATHNSGSFAGANNCIVDVSNLSGGTGGGTLECVGPAGASFGPLAITLTQIACPAPADPARTGPAIGQ